MQPKHFLDLNAVPKASLRQCLDIAHQQKAYWKGHGAAPFGAAPLAGKQIALIFEKPSTRTRFSFETGITCLGGHAIVAQGDEMQLGRGETLGDTARVLSRYVDAIMIRTDLPSKLDELVETATIPVINGLTDQTHPCQVMADVMTLEAHFGSVEGLELAWLGAGNNVCRSLVQGAATFGYNMRIATPKTDPLDAETLAQARAAGAKILEASDPIEAASQADVIVTDTWVSMGEDETANRISELKPYQVNSALMAHAKDTAVFLHCLPAHRGEEVTDEVLDGPQSLAFEEAENRLHAQAGIMLWALTD